MSEDDAWRPLAVFTPARIAQGRAGNGLPTRRVLEFQLAHARARDAVHAPFDAPALARALGSPARLLTTQAKSRADYLAFPGHGRTLDEASRATLALGRFDAALVIADGLSATAITLHAAALAAHILEAAPNVHWAPVSIVTNGRVAVGDDVAAALGADLAVVMIGERPGLSTADSIGLYLTWRPHPGATSDAQRNCISNVRPGGLEPAEGARRLAWLMNLARQRGLTGVGLKEDAPEALPDGRPTAC